MQGLNVIGKLRGVAHTQNESGGNTYDNYRCAVDIVGPLDEFGLATNTSFVIEIPRDSFVSVESRLKPQVGQLVQLGFSQILRSGTSSKSGKPYAILTNLLDPELIKILSKPATPKAA